jgi:hypothetical protein
VAPHQRRVAQRRQRECVAIAGRRVRRASDREAVAGRRHALQLQLEAVERDRLAGLPDGAAASQQRIGGAVAQLPAVVAVGRREDNAGRALRVGRHDDGRTLESALGAIEQRLAALGSALRDHDAPAIEAEAQQLQRALAAAIRCFAQAAREPGGVPPVLRERLARAGGQVAAQRESLARATAALDRAIDVLMVTPQRAAAYAPQGVLQRAPRAAFVGA